LQDHRRYSAASAARIIGGINEAHQRTCEEVIVNYNHAWFAAFNGIGKGVEHETSKPT
jgi:hypothetical protein